MIGPGAACSKNIVPNAQSGELADDDGLRGCAIPYRRAGILQASPRIALLKIVREVWSGICWASAS
jgi:hypothetical protein